MAAVLVVGGGMGGIVAANMLRKTLSKEHRVILIDRRSKHTFFGAFPMLMINRRRPENIQVDLTQLEHKGISFIQAEVEGINSSRSKIYTDNGSISYDYLILSPGVEHHTETVQGFDQLAYNAYSLDDVNHLRRQLRSFREGKLVFFISSLPFSCSPAPYEMVFLLDDYFRRRNTRKQVEITMVTPELGPEPLGEPHIGASIRNMLRERQVNYYSEARVLSLDTDNKLLNLDQGISIPGDIFIGIPSHWGPGFLKNTSFVEDGGWIKVKPDTLETFIENVFAIGDATNIRLPVKKTWAPKAGIFAHCQGEVVAKNIAQKIAGRKPTFRYKAKGM